jgi:hypothetical protein
MTNTEKLAKDFPMETGLIDAPESDQSIFKKPKNLGGIAFALASLIGLSFFFYRGKGRKLIDQIRNKAA